MSFNQPDHESTSKIFENVLISADWMFHNSAIQRVLDIPGKKEYIIEWPFRESPILRLIVPKVNNNRWGREEICITGAIDLKKHPQHRKGAANNPVPILQEYLDRNGSFFTVNSFTEVYPYIWEFSVTISANINEDWLNKQSMFYLDDDIDMGDLGDPNHQEMEDEWDWIDIVPMDFQESISDSYYYTPARIRNALKSFLCGMDRAWLSVVGTPYWDIWWGTYDSIPKQIDIEEELDHPLMDNILNQIELRLIYDLEDTVPFPILEDAARVVERIRSRQYQNVIEQRVQEVIQWVSRLDYLSRQSIHSLTPRVRKRLMQQIRSILTEKKNPNK